MQRRIVISDRPYWITTHDLGGEWYAVGDFNGKVLTVAAGTEAEVIRLWREAAEAPEGRGGAPLPSESE